MRFAYSALRCCGQSILSYRVIIALGEGARVSNKNSAWEIRIGVAGLLLPWIIPVNWWVTAAFDAIFLYLLFEGGKGFLDQKKYLFLKKTKLPNTVLALILPIAALYPLISVVLDRYDASHKRHVSASQKKGLISLLSETPLNNPENKYVMVEYLPYDNEAESFGEELSGIIEGSNFPGGGLMQGSPPRNANADYLQIEVVDINHPPAIATKLLNSLNEIGLKAQLIQNEHQVSADTITLYVVSKK